MALRLEVEAGSLTPSSLVVPEWSLHAVCRSCGSGLSTQRPRGRSPFCGWIAAGA
jgi:hypothetical protein